MEFKFSIYLNRRVFVMSTEDCAEKYWVQNPYRLLSNNKMLFHLYNLLIAIFIHCHMIVAGCYGPPHDSGGVYYYGFTLDISVSVRPLYFHPPDFSFPDDNLCKHQWIFMKLGMCIDIVEIWFGIVNGQILSNFYRVICLRHNGRLL